MSYVIAESIPHFLDRYGLLAIFAVMLVKEIGVPLPIPGDLIMLSAAARSASGQLVLWQAFLTILIALVVGDWSNSRSPAASAGRCSITSGGISGSPLPVSIAPPPVSARGASSASPSRSSPPVSAT